MTGAPILETATAATGALITWKLAQQKAMQLQALIRRAASGRAALYRLGTTAAITKFQKYLLIGSAVALMVALALSMKSGALDTPENPLYFEPTL